MARIRKDLEGGTRTGRFTYDTRASSRPEIFESSLGLKKTLRPSEPQREHCPPYSSPNPITFRMPRIVVLYHVHQLSCLGCAPFRQRRRWAHSGVERRAWTTAVHLLSPLSKAICHEMPWYAPVPCIQDTIRLGSWESICYLRFQRRLRRWDVVGHGRDVSSSPAWMAAFETEPMNGRPSTGLAWVALDVVHSSWGCFGKGMTSLLR